MTTCVTVSITVTAAIVSLWLKHRMKHIWSRCSYLSSSSTSEMTLWYLSLFSLWLGPVIWFYSAFLHHSSYFFSLTWTLVRHISALLLFSLLRHCSHLGLELEVIGPGERRYCACAREGHCPVCAAWLDWVIDISQTPPLALIGCDDPGVVDSCKSNYSHWVEPQTADLRPILLSYHNDNFSKYNKRIVTDRNFNSTCFYCVPENHQCEFILNQWATLI